MRRVTDLVRRRTATDKAKRAPPRAAPRHWRRWLGIAALAGVVMAAGVAAWLVESGRASDFAARLKDAAVEHTAALGLAVGDVLLEGRVHTPRGTVLRAVGVRRGDPILTVDPHRIARRVGAISWVESVVVERRLPATLYVRIVERTPMALWQRNGRLALIDRGGVVLKRRDLSKFGGLMTVVGGDAPRHEVVVAITRAVETPGAHASRRMPPHPVPRAPR